MAGILAALTLLLIVALVGARVLMLRGRGVEAMAFGRIDKKDFLIPPFALFYFYLVFAAAFHLPSVSRQAFFTFAAASWIGVGLCLAGGVLLLLSLMSFGRSFRVGIDPQHPDRLVTRGIFTVTRNPIYVAFALVLLGEFLTFPNWILLLYLVAASGLFHRQVLREEEFLRQHYGPEYADYCRRVRRYL
jgi:protein-S-isoprenylcysteine O-methyltransferase Ste14